MLFEGCEEQYLVTGGPVRNGRDDVGHIILFHQAAGDGGIGLSDAGEQQAQIIIDLRHAADGGTGGPGNDLLFDGDGGAQSFYIVYIRLIHPGHELTGVGTKAFCVAALTFGEQCVDGQGGFSRAGDAGDHDQFVAGNTDTSIFFRLWTRAPFIKMESAWRFAGATADVDLSAAGIDLYTAGIDVLLLDLLA